MRTGIILVAFLIGTVLALPLNQVYQKGSHNSYQRDESIKDQLNYHRVRSIEFDVHLGRSGCNSPGSAVIGNWYVYHACLVDDGTMVRMLSDGLKEVQAWHNANPNHELITIFIDMEDNFDTTDHSPAQFDSLLNTYLGTSLFTPADLLALAPGATTLKQAVTGTNMWPDTSAMKGKFMVFITKGQSSYASSDSVANGRKAFVAASSATTLPTAGYIVLVNQDGTDAAQAAFSTTAYNNGLLSRHWYVLSSDISTTNWQRSVTNKANFIAHNLVNFHIDPALSSHDTVTGLPFRPFSGTLTGVYESQNIISMRITSEDVWGSNDHFVFLSTTISGAWTTEVSTANSHTPNDWAKGGIMYRENMASNARYFAVLRGADANVLRIQYRTTVAGSTTSVDAGVIQGTGSEQQSRDFIKAVCTYTSPDTTCAGYGSMDGVTWTQIGSNVVFSSVNLSNSGIFASSHGNVANADGSQTKFVFTNVKQGTTLKTSSMLTQSNIGSVYGTPIIKDSIF